MTSLTLTMHGSTAVLTMNRPEARNALDQSMREEFTRLVPQIRDDRAIKAVVLTGAGGHFCAGGSLGSFASAIGRPHASQTGTSSVAPAGASGAGSRSRV